MPQFIEKINLKPHKQNVQKSNNLVSAKRLDAEIPGIPQDTIVFVKDFIDNSILNKMMLFGGLVNTNKLNGGLIEAATSAIMQHLVLDTKIKVAQTYLVTDKNENCIGSASIGIKNFIPYTLIKKLLRSDINDLALKDRDLKDFLEKNEFFNIENLRKHLIQLEMGSLFMLWELLSDDDAHGDNWGISFEKFYDNGQLRTKFSLVKIDHDKCLQAGCGPKLVGSCVPTLLGESNFPLNEDWLGTFPIMLYEDADPRTVRHFHPTEISSPFTTWSIANEQKCYNDDDVEFFQSMHKSSKLQLDARRMLLKFALMPDELIKKLVKERVGDFYTDTVDIIIADIVDRKKQAHTLLDGIECRYLKVKGVDSSLLELTKKIHEMESKIKKVGDRYYRATEALKEMVDELDLHVLKLKFGELTRKQCAAECIKVLQKEKYCELKEHRECKLILNRLLTILTAGIAYGVARLFGKDLWRPKTDSEERIAALQMKLSNVISTNIIPERA